MTDQVESPGAPVTVEHTDSDGASFSITTNTQTEEGIREALEVDTEEGPKEKPDLSKSASELGKKGGEAAAKARAKAAKETPEEEPPEEEEPEAAKPLGKPRHDPRARVAQVTREHAETKRRLEAEQREKEELRRRLADVEARTRTPEEREQVESRERERKPPEPPGKPQPEDFEEFEQYLEARDDWRDRVREMRYAVERDHQERSSRLHEVKTGFATAIQETLASDADFMDRVSPEVSALVPTFELDDGRRPYAKNWIADELVLSPKDAPALMLYLSEHPDELQRIAALKSHREVTRELARLPLEAAPTGTNSRGRSVSRAFPPIKPVSGEPHVALDEGSDEESFNDFMRREDAREAKRRASRR
jgi:hypothetical protein